MCFKFQILKFRTHTAINVTLFPSAGKRNETYCFSKILQQQPNTAQAQLLLWPLKKKTKLYVPDFSPAISHSVSERWYVVQLIDSLWEFLYF